MADLLKILKEKRTQGEPCQPIATGNKPTAPAGESQPSLTGGNGRELVGFSPQLQQAQEGAVPNAGRTTRWGIPIPEGWDPNHPIFQRHPLECTCFRDGVLRCAVPCVWAWPAGAKPGDKAMRLNIG